MDSNDDIIDESFSSDSTEESYKIEPVDEEKSIEIGMKHHRKIPLLDSSDDEETNVSLAISEKDTSERSMENYDIKDRDVVPERSSINCSTKSVNQPTSRDSNCSDITSTSLQTNSKNSSIVVSSENSTEISMKHHRKVPLLKTGYLDDEETNMGLTISEKVSSERFMENCEGAEGSDVVRKKSSINCSAKSTNQPISHDSDSTNITSTSIQTNSKNSSIVTSSGNQSTHSNNMTSLLVQKLPVSGTVLVTADNTDITYERNGAKVETSCAEDDANESVLFTKPRMRKPQIIDSDTESDDETNVSSEEDIPKLSSVLNKMRISRISQNFKNLKSDLCSTMVGQESVMVLESDSSDIIDISEEENVKTAISTPKIPHVPASNSKLILKKPPTPKDVPLSNVQVKSEHYAVTMATYKEHEQTVKKLEAEIAQVANILRIADLEKLPDKGNMLRSRYQSIEQSLKIARNKIKNMVVTKEEPTSPIKQKPISWEDIKVESDIVHPKTFGQKALQTYNVQKGLTMDRLHQLHGSLSSCPTEDVLATDPEGLKVNLMPHQKHALAWLLWREQQEPSGGILADDMGLGKTLTMISLMLKSREMGPDRDNKENAWRENRRELIQGGTLIVCPASLVKQWEAEVNKHCRRGCVNIYCYHGPKREPKSKYLAKYDMVITTYTICQTEREKNTPLFNINWRRIILDEGHQIRNHKSNTSLAACKLEGKSRWILTGTPIQNKELDMYALMKFLHCTPFDDYGVWKMWIANKDTGGYQRLQTVISSLMLRRTKSQLQEKGCLQSLPQREWKIVEVLLSEDETVIYEKVLIFSRTIFAQYLHQRSNKGAFNDLNGRPTVSKPVDPNSPYYKIYEKMASRCKEVKQHEILLILLRLRQCCCHPSLITQMLEKAELEDDDDAGVMNLMEELQKLDLEDSGDKCSKNTEVTSTKKFNIDNPLFSSEYKSKKVHTIVDTVKDITREKREKVIIVSQWTSFLKVIGYHLKKQGIRFEQLDGTLNIAKRMEIIQNINNSSHPTMVLLLSLTAGGVGLNLVGANHLLLVDIHWNPQLELQAQDRIYRVGQKRPVNIYKFVTKNTIEERVKDIQDYKLSVANSMLTGAKMQHTKLSLQDLRMLFNV